MTGFLTLWLYQKRFLEETVITRMVTVLISMVVIIYFIAIIVNIFRPVLFLVTGEGLYSDVIEDRISILLDLFCRIREMVGGSLTIESAPGKGTKVTIRIPKLMKGMENENTCCRR